MSTSMLIVLFVLSTIFEMVSIVAVLMILKGKIDALSTKIEEIYSSMRSAQGFIQCELSKIHGLVVGNECMLDTLEQRTGLLIEKDESFSVRLGGISGMLESVAFAVDLIGNEIRKKNEGEIEVGSGGSDEKVLKIRLNKNDAK